MNRRWEYPASYSRGTLEIAIDTSTDTDSIQRNHPILDQNVSKEGKGSMYIQPYQDSAHCV